MKRAGNPAEVLNSIFVRNCMCLCLYLVQRCLLKLEIWGFNAIGNVSLQNTLKCRGARCLCLHITRVFCFAFAPQSEASKKPRCFRSINQSRMITAPVGRPMNRFHRFLSEYNDFPQVNFSNVETAKSLFRGSLFIDPWHLTMIKPCQTVQNFITYRKSSESHRRLSVEVTESRIKTTSFPWWHSPPKSPKGEKT